MTYTPFSDNYNIKITSFDQLLGNGAFSNVYAANNNTIAVKKIKNYIHHKKQLNSEIEIIKMLSRKDSNEEYTYHPNIIQFLGCAYSHDELCIVMELVEGGDLCDKIRKEDKLSETSAAHLFGQMISAIYHVHKNNISHRDIKLENFVIDTKNNVKLIDFGLSAKGQVFTDKVGSDLYMAPEILMLYNYNGMIADIWSLGMCLFAMVNGFIPFTSMKKSAWFNYMKKLKDTQTSTQTNTKPNHASSTLHIILELYNEECVFSTDLVDLINKMLYVNPKIRFNYYTDITKHPWFCQTI